MHISVKAQVLLQEGRFAKYKQLSLSECLDQHSIITLKHLFLGSSLLNANSTIFEDPITNEEIHMACVVSSGHILSRATIETWLERKSKDNLVCPLTRVPLLSRFGPEKKPYLSFPSIDKLISCYRLLCQREQKIETELLSEKKGVEPVVAVVGLRLEKGAVELTIVLNGENDQCQELLNFFTNLLVSFSPLFVDSEKSTKSSSLFTRYWSQISPREFSLSFCFPTIEAMPVVARTFSDFHLNQLVKLCAEILSLPVANMDLPLAKDFSLSSVQDHHRVDIIIEVPSSLSQLLELVRRFMVFTNRVASELQHKVFNIVDNEHGAVSATLSPAVNSAQVSSFYESHSETNPLKKLRALPSTYNDNVLFEEFSRLLKEHRYELYVDLLLMKTALPNRNYIDLAIEMIFDADQKINFCQKQFIMLVSLSNFSTKAELAALIKNIEVSQLPEEWLSDLHFWQLFYSNELELHKTSDKFLKSWEFTCKAVAKLSERRSQFHDAEHLCQKALVRNPANAKAISYSIYARAQLSPDNMSLSEAAGVIQHNNTIFGENTWIAKYLNSLIAKYIYLPQYLENGSSLEIINALGIDIYEPFMRQAQVKYIHLIQGKVNDQSAYFFVKLRPSVLAIMKEIRSSSLCEVNQLGTVIYACFGEAPGQRILNRIYREYCVDSHEFAYANSVKEKIIFDYQSALRAYENRVYMPKSIATELQTIDPSILLSSTLVSQNEVREKYIQLWQSELVLIKSYKKISFSEGDVLKIKRDLKAIHQLTNTSSYLVKLLAVHLASNSLILVVEKGEHDSLKSFLSSDIPTISWSIRLNLAYQISCGLRYLHNNHIAHKNLKSSNVILFSGYTPKLTGFSFFESENQLGRKALSAEDSVDNIRYKAPECLLDVASIDDQISDIWSLGMLFFELSSRYQPFHDATTPSIVKSWIARGLREHPPESCEVEQPQFALLMRSCFSERKKRLKIDDITQSDCFKYLNL